MQLTVRSFTSGAFLLILFFDAAAAAQTPPHVSCRASSGDKSIHVLEGMSHQLLQDRPERTERVIRIMLEWILARI